MRLHAIISAVALALCAGPALSQIPPLMNYQGSSPTTAARPCPTAHTISRFDCIPMSPPITDM